MTNARWVYDFAQGSREMRELLGGKGANVTEMTRVLGAGRVPAALRSRLRRAWPISDAAPSAMGSPQRSMRRWRGWSARSADARRPRGPAAGIGALGRTRVEAGDARHGA